ncbi:MAG: hypothetical protein HQM00_08345, partial [Magnetococcales bacterium]|nr:hypothetical protein [Magnetococcales bacterium]
MEKIKDGLGVDKKSAKSQSIGERSVAVNPVDTEDAAANQMDVVLQRQIEDKLKVKQGGKTVSSSKPQKVETAGISTQPEMPKSAAAADADIMPIAVDIAPAVEPAPTPEPAVEAAPTSEPAVEAAPASEPAVEPA